MFPSDTDFDTRVTLETEAMPVDEESPFHILLLGDWSGRESRSSTPTALNFRPIEIDRDNFSDVMRRLNIKLELKFQDNSETALSLNFTELDDFHPDKIFQQLPLFADLRSTRQRLTKADTFNEAAREVRSWLSSNIENPEIEQPEKSVVSQTNEPRPDNLLDQILGKTDGEFSANKSTDKSELSAFISELVRPHIIQTDTEEQSRLLMIVDEVTSDLMRKILHHPQFQALEAAWRGVYLLVKRIETDAFLKLFLFDITKDELAANLKSVNNLSDCDAFRALIEESVEPWALFCGNYTFGLNVNDVSALIRLAKFGAAADSPFISHIEPEMFGFKSFASDAAFDRWQIAENTAEGKLWDSLRSIPDSKYLGLALPRFLARLPYGEQSEPTETFYFEEFTSLQEHHQYLWANPGFICALLFAQSFQKSGWNLTANFSHDVDGLPIYLYKDDGKAKTKPCAEIVMSESNCEKLLKQGLMPLICFRDSDRLRLGQLQSIAYPSSGLKGRWK